MLFGRWNACSLEPIWLLHLPIIRRRQIISSFAHSRFWRSVELWAAGKYPWTGWLALAKKIVELQLAKKIIIQRFAGRLYKELFRIKGLWNFAKFRLTSVTFKSISLCIWMMIFIEHSRNVCLLIPHSLENAGTKKSIRLDGSRKWTKFRC